MRSLKWWTTSATQSSWIETTCKERSLCFNFKSSLSNQLSLSSCFSLDLNLLFSKIDPSETIFWWEAKSQSLIFTLLRWQNSSTSVPSTVMRDAIAKNANASVGIEKVPNSANRRREMQLNKSNISKNVLLNWKKEINFNKNESLICKKKRNFRFQKT